MVDGIILETVNGIDRLTAAPLDLTIRDIVVNTVNQIQPIESLRDIGYQSLARGQPIDRAVDLRDYMKRAPLDFPGAADAWGIQSLKGYSLRMDVERLAEGSGTAVAQIIVDTLIREDQLMIEISNSLAATTDKRVTSYSVVQADGRPLPAWVSYADHGLLLAEVPSGGGVLELKVTAQLTDGSQITRAVSIHLETGEVHEVQIVAEQRAPLFEQQLQRRSAN